MKAPRWARWLLARLAPRGRGEDLVGDLEEVHRRRLARRGPAAAWLLTSLDALDVARAIVLGGRLPFSWLDFKLGLRMLVRHPGLTVLGGLSLTFAILAGATTFEFFRQLLAPDLGFPGGDRIVAVEVWDARNGGRERRALWDYAHWADRLTSVEELGAYRNVRRNLRAGDEPGQPIFVAEIDPRALRLSATAPLLGRTLTDDDTRPGAPLVVVLGHAQWRARFGGDPGIVGQEVGVGRARATVVGVMPEGFAFPLAHEAWLPLRLETSPEQARPREGPDLSFLGRRAPGIGLEEAQVELSALGRTLAATSPATHEHLHPRVLTLPRAALGLGPVSGTVVSTVVVGMNLPAVLFVILVCGNVGLLLFARAAAREGEMLVRSALGASRLRIVGQLFVEALLLALLAAATGLALARYGLGWWLHIVEVALWEAPLPFWFRPSLSPETVAYSVGLAVVAAVVAGVVPGLKVTSGTARLREASPGAGGVRIGGVWTAVIVCQIAVTVVAPVVAVGVHVDGLDERGAVALPLDDSAYLTALAGVDHEGSGPPPAEGPYGERHREVLEELRARLEEDPRVAGVTFAERVPRMYHPFAQIEVDGPAAEPRDERGHRVAPARVTLDYREVLRMELKAGRWFLEADRELDPGVVVVNESFVRSVLGDRNPLGRRIRYVHGERTGPLPEPGPWMEVVGVVEDMGTISGYGPMGVYHLADLKETWPVHLAVHLPGGAAGFQGTLRAVAAGVSPELRLESVETLAEVADSERAFYAFWTAVAGGTTLVALLLSLGGIYAVLSFAVARRTREIGIRAALGSPSARVVADVMRRPLAQVALGLVVGAALLGSAIVAGRAYFDPRMWVFLAGYMVLITAVCLTASVAPIRRALAVEPAEALRGEG